MTLVDNQKIESLSERFMTPEIEITAVIVRNLSSVERKVLCAVMEVVSPLTSDLSKTSKDYNKAIKISNLPDFRPT